MMLTLLFAMLQTGAPVAEVRDYFARLETPGGSLEFGLSLSRAPDEPWRAFLRNGPERIEIPSVRFDGSELVLDLPHYDSSIRATVGNGLGLDVLNGTWRKRRGTEKVAELTFKAMPAMKGYDRFPRSLGPPPREVLTGRWAVDFGTEDQDAVAILEQDGDNLTGTVLTTTGDYRYLAGGATALLNGTGPARQVGFTLSCFDGAHAFLFEARMQPDGTLKGDFWSGNWYHDTWTARRDDAAALPDAFAQTSWNGRTKLADLAFPDLDGVQHSLGEFAGKVTLLVVFGSWCPNCNDEAKLLGELDTKYRARGLRILGLAFELTGEPARDAEQVRIFAQRHALEIPFFLCGTADKDEATKALGLVDRVRSFPTTVFVGADGLPKAIHSGFAGPATGEEHVKLRRDFEARIEALLGQ